MHYSQALKKQAKELVQVYFDDTDDTHWIDVHLVDWRNKDNESNGLLSIMFRAKERYHENKGTNGSTAGQSERPGRTSD